MGKYLVVHIEGCNVGCRHEPIYDKLDPGSEYTDKDLQRLGRDMVNEVHPWGYDVVDESEVPEGER